LFLEVCVLVSFVSQLNFIYFIPLFLLLKLRFYLFTSVFVFLAEQFTINAAAFCVFWL